MTSEKITLSENQLKSVKEMMSKGFSVLRISETLKINVTTLKRRLDSLGLVREKWGERKISNAKTEAEKCRLFNDFIYKHVGVIKNERG